MRILIIIIGLAILFAVLMHFFPYALASEEEKSHVVYYAIFLVAISASLFARRDISWKTHSQYALAWLGIILVLMVGYSFRDEVKNSRFIGELLPSNARMNDRGEIVLYAREDGHFYVEALVNHTPLLFMVDTGATGISLSRKDAQRAGIEVNRLTYNIPHSTANGISFSASETMGRLEIAGLVFEQLPVSISKEGRLERSLLGMTFLRKLQSYRVEGDVLTLVP